MGYFANGFVFTTEPDFKAITAVIPDRSVRGYKHNQRPIWLADIWKPRGNLRRRAAPFCDEAVSEFQTEIATLDTATRQFLAAFQHLQGALGCDTSHTEVAFVHLALAVAKVTKCSTYFFAADDEETDMACQAAPGSLVSFGCRLPYFAIRYTGGHTLATPLNDLEDDTDQDLRQAIAKVRGVPAITLQEPRDIEGGQVLYENPVEQWPIAAGDPAEILGLGTWDPLTNVESDFVVVFERLT